MILGSPLTPSSTKVMLLGSGELGKEVIISLQRFGVEVIAVDRYENAPGQQVAHRAYTIDMTDAALLKALIIKEKPHLIVPEIEALNTDVLAEVEREGLATVIPTVKAVQLTMNREGIRRLAAEELKLPVSPYAFARSSAELQASIDGVDGQKAIGYPCFIKPTMSSSGKGQSRVTEKSQVQAAWDYAATGGRVNLGVVIVEGQIDFDYEITLLTVRAKNATGDTETYFCEP
ncbi:MAG TPA: ATP-grasp domain-containing protein, partial [Methylotenera sp.]|nr:ATP-grasp domain-containing protein [Methylotenera sp.]